MTNHTTKPTDAGTLSRRDMIEATAAALALPLLPLPAGARLAALTKMADEESDPKTPAGRFFGRIKGRTIQAYYTSKTGIHTDQEYKGNVFQTGDYAGFDAT